MKKIKPFNLFEVKLEKFTFEDVYTPEYINDIMREDFVRDFFYLYEEEHSDEEVEIDSEEFKKWIVDFLKEEYKKFLYNFCSKTDYFYGSFEIYREITVEDNWIEHIKSQGKHLGIYWSWEEDIAEAHNGDWDKKNIVNITCEIKDTDVDWVETIKLNTHPSFNDEKEIRLFKGTPLKITNLLINNILIEDNIIYSKTFYA